MNFAVVRFLKRKKNDIVPIKWLFEDKCFWPPKKLQPKILPRIYQNILPNPSWPKYRTQTLRLCETHSMAVKVLKKSSVTSDLNTTDPEKLGRGERHKFKKRLTLSSAVSSDNETDIEGLPEFAQYRQPLVVALNSRRSDGLPLDTLTASEGIDATDGLAAGKGYADDNCSSPEDQDNKTDEYSDNQGDTGLGLTVMENELLSRPSDSRLGSSCESATPSIGYNGLCSEENQVEQSESLLNHSFAASSNKRTPSFGECSHNPPAHGGFQKRTSSLRGVDRAILKELALLKASLRVLDDKQDVIIKLLTNLRSSSENVPTEINSWMKLLPLTTQENLTRIEVDLENENSFSNFVQMLMKVGGGSWEVFVKNMLRKILTDKFAANFSFMGIRGKPSFKALTLCKAVKCAVRTHALFKETPETDVEKGIMNWLRHANGRACKLEIYQNRKK